ncbi:sugar ABC transporter permease [Carboxydochorda subterranea]|uniref:Sugar ABC transporter permease n=1 Tax=Carboxydichorda subterranea TaxID=3109565 RepID=A0ABZ1BXR6_9FIRM|nr:sugar ABC transporter permease [Limnochorda sp. L945t]WRP17489.1 sugar ABC transporter permease [Limnochorda sp. L945t]
MGLAGAEMIGWPRLSYKTMTKRILLLPAAVWTLLFTVFPFVYTLWISTQRIRLGRPGYFVGMENFAKAFADYKLSESALGTILFIAVAVPLELILGFAFALLFNRDFRGQGVLRAIMTMPLFATPVGVAYLFTTILYEEGGLVNSLLAPLGWHPPWLSNPFWARLSVLLVDVWQWTPFCFLVFLAGLQGLPQEVLEAASLDVVKNRQIVTQVVLPMMAPLIRLVLLLRFIEAAKVFDTPFVLTSGGPGRSTEVYSLYTFRVGLRFFDLGYAAALSLLLLVAVMIVANLLFRGTREMYD